MTSSAYFAFSLTNIVIAKSRKKGQKTLKNLLISGITQTVTNLSLPMSEINDGTVITFCHIYIIINK